MRTSIALLLLGLAGCGGGNGGTGDAGGTGGNGASDAGAAPTFAADVKPILTSGGCLGHHMTPAWDGVNTLTANAGIVSYFTATHAKECGGTPALIVAGDAAHSYLYQKISAQLDPSCTMHGAQMPLGGALSAAQIATVKEWIDTGASND